MQDNRRYVRMSTVFPVEFAIVGLSSGEPERLLQGFTCNVSEGGMCIEFKTFGKEDEDHLADSASLKLTINPSFSRDPIHALACIAWLKKEDHSRYLIGISYESIDALARKRLIGYARRRQWTPRIVAMTGIALLAALTVLAVFNRVLIAKNLKFAQEVREGAVKKSQVASELVTLADSRRSLELQLDSVREEKERLQKAVEGLNKEVALKVTYENELIKSRAREAGVRLELESIQNSQDALRKSYVTLEESARKDSKTTLKWMAKWLASHRNTKTGLVASFEGDPSLQDTAFTYDQALAAQAFVLSGELNKAAAILNFYDMKAKDEKGGFYNAYDSVSGEPSEMLVRVGPNIWVGIAALQYTLATRDACFASLARRLGDWAIHQQDAEGGLAGGPDVTWYSTEHNLDAYAFFGMLADATGNIRFRNAQEKSLAWLKKYAFSNKAGGVNRGKGDATIATDTFAWSIAAVGPKTLTEMGFDPEAILDFAEQHCAVKVKFVDAEGKSVEIQGFDSAKAQNIGRGGVVSTEWTSQMIVSYQVMARYFRDTGDAERARGYSEKAGFYFNEMQKMLIASPSKTGQGRGCLPYASMDNVDTGHGWRTPAGSRTGSVAGTAYGLFAGKDFNPFELPEHKGEKIAGL